MADFRKWFLAFAVAALLLGLGSTAAYAQTPTGSTGSINCVANGGVPPVVRAEGITELVGDVVLNCSGGTPTAAGAPIPRANIQIFLNTNVTSRIMNTGTNASEALLLIDDPGGLQANAAPQEFCSYPLTNCTVIGNGGVDLVGTGGGIPGLLGPYNGAGASGSGTGGFNIYQGQQNGTNSLVWNGVPIDAPGTTATRTIRITNVRANACNLGLSSTIIPTQLVMYIAINSTQNIALTNPQITVGFIQRGLVSSNGSTGLVQCQNANGSLVASGSSIGQVTGPSFTVTAREGFASAFKTRFTGVGSQAQTGVLQDIPGFPYYAESGFVSAATGGLGSGAIGVADFGTRIAVSFANVGAGVNVYVPLQINLTAADGVSTTNGVATLVTTDSTGNGGYSPASSAGTSGGVSVGSVGVNGTGAIAVYEITQADPNVVEQLRVPVTVGFLSNTGQNLPALGVSTATLGFAPTSNVGTASATAPIPRFCPSINSPGNVITINSCTCNLLFPFVTNQAGFDTGIAIANTSLDPFGTPPQTGTVTLNYYGGTPGGGAAPPAQTSQKVPAGQELVFTVSNGGNLGVTATQGFQGYIIATAQFQYCHGFAFISDLGAQKVAEGYLAIQLDVPALNRTGLVGENEGH